MFDTIQEDLNILHVFDNDMYTSKVRRKYSSAFS